MPAGTPDWPTTLAEEAKWDAVGGLFLNDPDQIYLNIGSWGVLARPGHDPPGPAGLRLRVLRRELPQMALFAQGCRIPAHRPARPGADKASWGYSNDLPRLQPREHVGRGRRGKEGKHGKMSRRGKRGKVRIVFGAKNTRTRLGRQEGPWEMFCALGRYPTYLTLTLPPRGFLDGSRGILASDHPLILRECPDPGAEGQSDSGKMGKSGAVPVVNPRERCLLGTTGRIPWEPRHVLSHGAPDMSTTLSRWHCLAWVLSWGGR